jgi:hypothetical protein
MQTSLYVKVIAKGGGTLKTAAVKVQTGPGFHNH